MTDDARAARAAMPTLPETVATPKPLDDWRDEAIANRVAQLISKTIEERDRRYVGLFAEMLANEREKFERHVTEESRQTRSNSAGLAKTIRDTVTGALDDHEKIRQIEVAVEQLRADVAHMKRHGVPAYTNGGAGGE